MKVQDHLPGCLVLSRARSAYVAGLIRVSREIHWATARTRAFWNALLFAVCSVCDFAPHHSQSGGAFSQQI